MHLHILFLVFGALGGPIIAAVYSSSSEVLLGRHIPFSFNIFRVAIGLGALIGPIIAGMHQRDILMIIILKILLSDFYITAGHIFDVTGSFKGLFYLTSLLYFLASVIYALIKLINIKGKIGIGL